MSAGPEIVTPEPAPVEPLPSEADTDIIPSAAHWTSHHAPDLGGDHRVELPWSDVKLRRWRRHRNRTIFEVAWLTEVGGDTQSVLYRQAPAAHRHADRLVVQGYRATVTEGRISSWSVIR